MSPSMHHLSSPSGSWLDTRPMPSDGTAGAASPVSSELSASTASPRKDAAAAAGWYYYLTPQAVRRLPNYQYVGGDTSPLFKHVLSPFAGWCVDNLTPAWVAPNAITLLGLSWMILSYFVIWYWCPGLYEANEDVANVADAYVAPESWFRKAPSPRPPGSYTVPGVIFLLNGVALLLYQTLDNMDGKQARKTGSSSPLGLLFDHGCDAMNLMLGSANWIAAMALVPGDMSDLLGRTDHGNLQERSVIAAFFGGDAVLAALLVLCPMIAFYVATWEQYHTGQMFLPPFNGPSEGLIMGAALSFISFLWGPMYWQGTTWADGAITRLTSVGGTNTLDLEGLRGRVRNLDLIVLVSVLALAQEVLLKLVLVMRRHGLPALRTAVPNVLLVAFVFAMVRHEPTIFLRSPRVMLHLINGLFTEMTTQLLLCHVVGERFRLRDRWCLYPPLGLVVFMAGVHVEPEAVDTLLLIYASGLWVHLVFKIRVQLYEVCDVLGIWCFDIVTPYPKRQEVVDEAAGVATKPVVNGMAKKNN